MVWVGTHVNRVNHRYVNIINVPAYDIWVPMEYAQTPRYKIYADVFRGTRVLRPYFECASSEISAADAITKDLDKQNKNQRKIVFFSYPSFLAYVLGAQNNRLIETHVSVEK